MNNQCIVLILNLLQHIKGYLPTTSTLFCLNNGSNNIINNRDITTLILQLNKTMLLLCLIT